MGCFCSTYANPPELSRHFSNTSRESAKSFGDPYGRWNKTTFYFSSQSTVADVYRNDRKWVDFAGKLGGGVSIFFVRGSDLMLWDWCTRK